MGAWPGIAALLPIAIAMASPSPGGAAGETPPGSIRFVGENLLFTARGEFRRWRVVEATVDEAEPERSRVVVEIDLASLDTGDAGRDEHLRSADFFDVARYPTARAVVEGFRFVAPDRVAAEATLELHGHVRRVPLVFTIVDRATRHVAAETTLRRTDFAIGPAPSRLNPLSVRDDVALRVDAIVPPASAPPAPGSPG
jgi:polyisoprenoid-binding protein YceI